jgi:hypothetical protein
MRRTLACALIVLAGCAGCSGAAPSPTRVPAALTVQSGPPASIAAGAGFRWSALARSPLGARSQPLVDWAGGQLLEFGGLVEHDTQATSAGAAFDPATGRWRRIAAVPAAAGVNLKDTSGLSENPASVWTGTYLAVANGLIKSCPKAGPTAVESTPSTTPATACWTGVALYDPTANRWTSLALPKQLVGLEVTAVAWTGRDIVVAAVDTAAFDTDQGRLAVAAYAPATGRWRVITPADVPRLHTPRFVDLGYAGGRLLLWSMWDRTAAIKNGFSENAGVDVLAMSSNGSWRNVTGSWPQEQSVPPPVSTGDGLLFAPGQIWCGLACSPPGFSEPGYFANPATLARKTIPAGPLGRAGPSFVWAGDAVMAVVQGTSVTGSGINIQPGDMALFQPAAARWTGLPAVPDHPSLSASPVWTGTELLSLTDAGSLFALHR